jgi:hypothetical protein
MNTVMVVLVAFLMVNVAQQLDAFTLGAAPKTTTGKRELERVRKNNMFYKSNFSNFYKYVNMGFSDEILIRFQSGFN